MDYSGIIHAQTGRFRDAGSGLHCARKV